MVINYSKQLISESDINSVSRTLRSDFLTTGPKIKVFEDLIKKKVKSKYSIVVNSATSALHISCLALGLTKNDYLWTSSNSFVASANCALYCNAKIDLVDINLENYNIDVSILEKKLKKAKKQKRLPKIIIPIAFAGYSSDMKKIYQLSKKYKFKIIEDASHALGGKYKNNMVGSNKYSDLTVFSFHPVKMITTGEGGAITTNNNNLAKKLYALRSHGIEKNLTKKQKKNTPWLFNQNFLGFNYRMTDIQASLGISQIKKLNFFIKKRNQIAKIYDKELKYLPLKLPKIKKNILSSFHLYVVLVKKNQKKISRNKLYFLLKKKGILTTVHYIPIYKHPYYKKMNFNMSNFKNNEEYFKNAISIPIYPGIKKKNIFKVINTLKKIFNE
tara:strand:- start:43 stop:1203 length:1161 start_codon:yes stop_codon:yes gene_type:complete